jgi:predicted PurR-regulated permease PerM
MNFPPTQRQARLLWFALSGLAIAVLVGLLVLLVWGLGRVLDILSPVLWPLAVAVVIAYLLEPIVDLFERKHLRRPIAIIGVFTLAFIIVGLVFANIVPTIVSQTREFRQKVPKIFSTVGERFEKWSESPLFKKLVDYEVGPSQNPPTPTVSTNEVTQEVQTNTPAPAPAPGSGAAPGGAIGGQTLTSVTGWLADFVPKAGGWLVSWVGVLVGLALIPIYAFYLLVEKQGIQDKWTNYLPVRDSKFKSELVFILQSINDYMIAFFRGQVLVAIIDGILYGAGFLAIRLDYAILIGASAMVLTIIPFIGATIIFVIAMAISLFQYGDWKHPLLVLMVFAIVQTLESAIISPRIMKGRVGLHPLTIIIAVMVGTTLLGGVLGGVLAIPVTAVLRVLMERYLWKRSPAKEPN